MRHLYESQTRWADLDLLGHTNNVSYADHLQDARVALLDLSPFAPKVDNPGEGLIVTRHEIDYLRSLPYTGEPVSVETWVSEVRAATFSIGYEIFTGSEQDGDRTRYATASTILSPFDFEQERPRRLTAAEREALGRTAEKGPVARRTRFKVGRTAAGRYDVQVRFSDLDIYRHVNNVRYLEYFQEARIVLLASLFEGFEDARARPGVVARAEIDYQVPVRLRPAPYRVWTQVAELGRSSLLLESELVDPGARDTEGAEVCCARARVTMVHLDPDTGKPAPWPEEVREVFEKARQAAVEALGDRG